MPIIRNAERRDARQLAELAEATFRATFGDANTPEDMNLHCQASYGEVIQASEICNPSMVTLLSEEGKRLIGFAQLRWGSSPKCVAAQSAGEIQRLYVAADWHGKGIAQDLMRACFTEMERKGSDLVWLGVWERNPRALSFYRKLGFAEVGDHVFAVGGDPQRDIVMTRSIVDSQSGRSSVIE